MNLKFPDVFPAMKFKLAVVSPGYLSKESSNDSVTYWKKLKEILLFKYI